MATTLYAPQGVLMAHSGLLRLPSASYASVTPVTDAYGSTYGSFSGVNAGALALSALAINNYKSSTLLQAVRGTSLSPPILSWSYNRAVRNQTIRYGNPKLGSPYDGLSHTLNNDARTYTPTGSMVGPNDQAITTDFSYRLSAYDTDGNYATTVVYGFFSNSLLCCSSPDASLPNLSQFQDTLLVMDDAAYWLALTQAAASTKVQPNQVSDNYYISIPVPVDTYFYYAVPANFAGVYQLTYQSSGNDRLEWSPNHLVGSTSYTNRMGFSETYNIYRSLAKSSGKFILLDQHVADLPNQTT